MNNYPTDVIITHIPRFYNTSLKEITDLMLYNDSLVLLVTYNEQSWINVKDFNYTLIFKCNYLYYISAQYPIEIYTFNNPYPLYRTLYANIKLGENLLVSHVIVNGTRYNNSDCTIIYTISDNLEFNEQMKQNLKI